jgi:C-terminal processing protease CtpA/Prc
MHLNTFSNARLRRFFHKSFSELKRHQIPNLILDIRTNGGGDVSTSTLLTKYISRKPFKVTDTLFSNIKTLYPYTRYFKGRFLNNIELFFLSRKKSDNKYHLTRYENKLFKPKRNNHFDGKVYVLINGPTFSASCVFANAIKSQDGIALLGEETGGGWYGNNGIMMPQITLPITKIRIRMPLFRLVQYKHIEANKGKGIMPDIYVPTSYDALLKGYDKKMELVKELILQSEKK